MNVKVPDGLGVARWLNQVDIQLLILAPVMVSRS